MEDFWARITLYMDRLHSMELLILEELDCCIGSLEEFVGQTTCGEKAITPNNANPLSTRHQNPISNNSLFSAMKATVSLDTGITCEDAEKLIAGLSGEELAEIIIAFLTKNDVNKQQFLAKKSSAEISDLKPTKMNSTNTRSNEEDEEERPKLENWEIDLYDVEFFKRIGRGSAGTTYLARWHGQDVACKVAAISEMGLGGWNTELSSLKQLHHPNIIRFLGAIYNPSPLTYCLVLEFCNGGDMSRALKKSTPSNFFNCIALGVANGLGYLHKKKILHRDIKPGNVLLHGDFNGGNFVAKLTDFGLAAMVQSYSVNDAELTAETGTYRYMAPEVIRHERYCFSADIYSFSLLLWEVLTREVPFAPASPIEAAASVAIEGSRPPMPCGIPRCIDTMLQKCWHENPDERMSVEQITSVFPDLDDELSDEEKLWVCAPHGHPVYFQHGDKRREPKQLKKPSGERKKGSFLSWRRKK